MNENEFYTSNITTMSVDLNKVFSLELFGKPQSGYLWTLDESYDQTNIKFFYAKNKPLPGYDGLQQIFYFKIFSIGVFDINFDYKRTWETIPLKRRTFTLYCE